MSNIQFIKNFTACQSGSTSGTLNVNIGAVGFIPDIIIINSITFLSTRLASANSVTATAHHIWSNITDSIIASVIRPFRNELTFDLTVPSIACQNVHLKPNRPIVSGTTIVFKIVNFNSTTMVNSESAVGASVGWSISFDLIKYYED